MQINKAPILFNDQTASRTFGSVYVNSARPRMVIIGLYHQDPAGAQMHGSFYIKVNGATKAFCGMITQNIAVGNADFVYTLTAVVPPGQTYQLTDDSEPGSTKAIVSWMELEL